MTDQEDRNPVSVIGADQWLSPGEGFSGEWQGAASGSRLSIIANHIHEIGEGAKRHRHPYAEVFLIRRGSVAFELGDERLNASEGQIVVVPAGVPHAFQSLGPEPLEMIDIHESGNFDTEWR